jgi:glycosyltransferase involved in cell wall biosynthesis
MLKKYTGKISYGSRFYVDTSVFRIDKDISVREEIVGYIGRFEEVKGVVNFVRAILVVQKESGGIKAMVWGRGPQKDEIEKEIINAGLGDSLRLENWIPHDELPRRLNELKLLVIPSYAEVGPHIVFEAMACGTPVLATPVGIIPDVIKDGVTGFIMEDNSPQCIARNIIRALNHPDLNQLIKNARELVEKEYTQEAAVNRYRNIIADLK